MENEVIIKVSIEEIKRNKLLQTLILQFKIKNDRSKMTVKEKCKLYCINKTTYYRYLKS
jgi:hypothetical protein